jgi:hypothetical protein
MPGSKRALARLVRTVGVGRYRRRPVEAATVLTICVALVTMMSPETAGADDSTRHARNTARGKGVAVPFEGFVGHDGGPVPIAGAVGVDLVLGSTSRPYLPCQNYRPRTGASDTFINACRERGSYATYTRFRAGAGLIFPHGYFMGNVQPDLVRDGLLRTDWGARTAGLSFEFYPELRHDGDFVHSRFYVDQFGYRAHGWTYSAYIGRIRLATLADPGTARIGGRLTDGGRPPRSGRVKIVIFGGAARSTAGYPISSFAVYTSTGAGRWTSGPIYTGPQHITVTDTATNRECVVELGRLTGRDDRLDFDVSRPGFGRRDARCTSGVARVNPLAPKGR